MEIIKQISDLDSIKLFESCPFVFRNFLIKKFSFGYGWFPIVKDLAFDVNKDYKRVFIKHTFEINDLEIPKEYLNDFVKARLYAIRKGKLIRQVNIDGEQVKKEYDLEV